MLNFTKFASGLGFVSENDKEEARRERMEAREGERQFRASKAALMKETAAKRTALAERQAQFSRSIETAKVCARAERESRILVLEQERQNAARVAKAQQAQAALQRERSDMAAEDTLEEELRLRAERRREEEAWASRRASATRIQGLIRQRSA